MKLQKKLLLSVMLMLILFTGVSCKDKNVSTEDINELWQPYQSIIDEVNKDHKYKFAVLPEDKEEVYNKVKNYTPDEFRKMLIDDYNDFLAMGEPDGIIIDDPDKFIKEYENNSEDIKETENSEYR